MALQQLSLESLKNLDDGRIKAALDQELRHVITDCGDRPGDKRARTVTLQIELKPITDEINELERVDVTMQVTSKTPTRKSKTYDMGLRKSATGPMLVYNELSLDNVDQETFPFDQDTQ